MNKGGLEVMNMFHDLIHAENLSLLGWTIK